MSKKLLKIKIQTKPVLKEGPSDVDTLLLEFAKLSKLFIQGSEAAANAQAVFKAFAKGTKGAARADVMSVGAESVKNVRKALKTAVKEVPKVLASTEEIFKKTLRNPDFLNRADDADAVLDGLKAMKDRLAKTAKMEGLNGTQKRKATELIKQIETKIDVIEGLMDSSISYISAVSRRAKEAGKAVDEVVDGLPLPKKVKFKDSEYATKELVDALGKEGAEQFAEKGSKWQKWLIAAGLLGTAAGIYKALETDTADADDKKPKPAPTPAPGGGGTTVGSYDLFNQLAVQVTGQKDVKEAVKMIQVMLVNLGYSVKKGETDSGFSPKKMLSVQLGAAAFKAAGVDGKVGEGTQGAVIRFQKANSLKPDGLVGPNTYTKLVSITKGGDKKKDTIPEPSKAEKVQAVRSIDALIKQLLDGNGWQRIINSYVEVQSILVTKLMNMMDASSISDAFKQNLRRQVQKALPSIPEGTPEERLKHAAVTMKSIPVSIKTKTLNSIDSSIVGKDIVEIILTVLERNIKEMEDGNKKLEESKKYDLDFSKWSKIF